MTGSVLVLLWTAIAGGGATAEIPRPESGSLCHSVQVQSEWHFSQQEAADDAQCRMEEAVIEYIASRWGDTLPQRELRRHLPRLLSAPGVRQETSTETIEKPYGTMYRRRISATLPEETVQPWAAEVAKQHQNQRGALAGSALLTVLGWWCAPMVIVKLDRWTLGYHRPAILLGTLSVLLSGTIVGWMLVLT